MRSYLDEQTTITQTEAKLKVGFHDTIMFIIINNFAVCATLNDYYIDSS